ncbi:MAG: nucleotide exchange factor GrpE [bacterium]
MDNENKGTTTDQMQEENTETPLTIEELKEALKDCAGQKTEYLGGWQRARADFQNYKKEEALRMEAIVGFSSEMFILKILPILDNFELAQKAIPEDLEENNHIKGMMLIKNQLDEFIKDAGITEIITTNQMFNPLFHEVVEEVDQTGVSSGVVVEETQKGYLLNGKVIRPAKVKLAK